MSSDRYLPHCPTCDSEMVEITCDECDGDGTYTVNDETGSDDEPYKEDCEPCDGTGYIIYCIVCAGKLCLADE